MEDEEIFKKLRPILGDKVDRLWLEYQLDTKNRSEISGVLQLLAAKHLGSRRLDAPALLEPPPEQQSNGDFTLGDVLYQNRLCGKFGIRRNEWIQHVGIFGRTGSGKTNCGFIIAKALIDNAVPVLVFDWKRNYRDLSQIVPGLKVFTVGRTVVPFAFNPLIPPRGTQPSTWLKKLIEIMCHVYFLGEGVAFLLQKAIDDVYEQNGVYSGTQFSFPTLNDVADWLVNAKVRGREAQWMDSAKRAIQTLCYGNVGAVLNSTSPTDLKDILHANTVLELDALTNSDKTFLIEALLLWIHHFRLQEGGRESLKHAILIEEAHHVLLKRKQSKEAITDVILREIRELGESIILLDQHPSLVSVPSLGNTYTTIAMNLKHGHDVTCIANAMLLSADEKEYIGRLPVGHAIVRLQGRWYRPFVVKFPLQEIKKGAVTDEDLVASNLGSSVPVVSILPSESNRNDILLIRRAEKLSVEEIEFLKDVMGNITSGIVERYSRLSLSSYLGNKIQNSLVSKGLLHPFNISSGQGRVRCLSLTEQARKTLSDLGYVLPARARGGPEHEYWKERVRQHLVAEGYAVETEKPIGGGSTIDLVAEKGGAAIAIEIETGDSDVRTNVNKCAEVGFETVVIVTTRQAPTSRIQRSLFKHPSTFKINLLVVDGHSLLTAGLAGLAACKQGPWIGAR